MQELKHKITIREKLSSKDLEQIKQIESKFKGSICLIALVDKVTKSNAGYYPVDSLLLETLEISRTNGQLNTIPNVVGG